MATTALFVELLVIGVGSTAVIVLVTLAVFGTLGLPLEIWLSTNLLVPELAFIYLLGIVADRVANLMLTRWSRSIREKRFGSLEKFQEARARVYRESPFKPTFEYNRSRLRICRGWCLNALLLVGASNVLIWSRLEGDIPRCTLSVSTTTGLLLLAAGCLYSWRNLINAEANNIEMQDRLLREVQQQ